MDSRSTTKPSGTSRHCTAQMNLDDAVLSEDSQTQHVTYSECVYVKCPEQADTGSERVQWSPGAGGGEVGVSAMGGGW